MLPRFNYERATSVQNAVSLLSADNARVYAGGTDLLGCLREGILPTESLVSISGLKGLRGIREKKDGLRIGALTTITEVAESSSIRQRFTALAQAASEVASPQLRNQGTLGGNLCQKPRCWYYRGEFDCLRKGGDLCYAVGGENQFHCILGGNACYIVHPSDTAPALVALGAEVKVQGPNGARTIAVEDLHVPPADDPQRETYLEPQEVITHVHVPGLPQGARSSYRKVRARRAWDFALAGVALVIVLDGKQVKEANVVLSGAAPVPWRAKEVENVLRGTDLDEDVVQKAADAAVRDAEPLAKNQYKVSLFRGLMREELRAIRDEQRTR